MQNAVLQNLFYCHTVVPKEGLAQSFVNERPNASITFVGHSKGGAEAAANGVATNRDFIIFNPATPNFGAYGLSEADFTASGQSFIIDGEVLDLVLRRTLMRGRPVDELISLNRPNRPAWQALTLLIPNVFLGIEKWRTVYTHGMDAVIEALRLAGFDNEEIC